MSFIIAFIVAKFKKYLIWIVLALAVVAAITLLIVMYTARVKKSVRLEIENKAYENVLKLADKARRIDSHVKSDSAYQQWLREKYTRRDT